MTSTTGNDIIELGKKETGVLAQKENSRAIQQVQASFLMAKKFPRDLHSSYQRIIDTCKRKRLAENAMYAYPRGKETVTGPSIRLAEVLAQNWGNLDFGIVELENKNGESVVESYCVDLETNVTQKVVFSVKHEKHTKKDGIKKLTDPRDIYEHIANNGARRLRKCILGIIPQDIVDDAITQCEKTLSSNSEPIAERVKKMVIAFKDLGVTVEMLEKKLGHKLEVIIEQEMLTLQKIFTSIRDGFTKREDWFEFASSEVENGDNERLNRLNKKFSQVENSLPPVLEKEI